MVTSSVLIGWYGKPYQESADYQKENQEKESGNQVMRELLQLSEMFLLEADCQGVREGVET